MADCSQTNLCESCFWRDLGILMNAIPIEDAANKLHVSKTTIQRWLEGKNLPYRLMRYPIIRSLRGLKKSKSQT